MHKNISYRRRSAVITANANLSMPSWEKSISWFTRYCGYKEKIDDKSFTKVILKANVCRNISRSSTQRKFTGWIGDVLNKGRVKSFRNRRIACMPAAIDESGQDKRDVLGSK